MSVPLLLSIGTTHPWNIAGTGLDARVAAEFGVRNATVIAGITAQDESGIRARFAVPAALVRAQFESLPLAHLCAIRVGAVFEDENVREVVRFLCAHLDVPAVVDPVFDATLGGAFANAATFEALRAGIFARPVVLTPNISEAGRLTSRTIANEDEMMEAARELLNLGAGAVLLKGGHLPGDPVDIFLTSTQTRTYRDKRLPGTMRGSGCTLAAALACELARGESLVRAVESARAFVRTKIAARNAYASLYAAF